MSFPLPTVEQALIIFVQYPELGSANPRLSAEIGEQAATSVVKALAERQIAAAASTEGVSPYIYFDPPEREDEVAAWLAQYEDRCAFAAQPDGSPSDRILGAFRRIFSRNVTQKVIVIGTECPGLDAGTIREAFAALDTSDVVVTPSASGGLCLFGMRRLVPQVIEGVKWRADGAHSQIIDNIGVIGLTAHSMAALDRVDSAETLGRMWPDWQRDAG